MIPLLPGISSTTAALDAERTRLDVIAQNIANASTTRGPDGKPYQRQVVVFESTLQQALDGSTPNTPPTLRVASIQKDNRAPVMIYDPSHPDADARGMVAMPNINIHEEMADLIVASRAFEANLAVARSARGLAIQTLAIGKA